MSDSVRPHRRQTTRLRCPWDSPGRNTGVGCHFLLPLTKRGGIVRSELSQEHSQVTRNWIPHRGRALAELPWQEPHTPHAANCACLGYNSLSFQNNAPESPRAAMATYEVQLWSRNSSPPASKARKPDAILTCPSSRSVFKYIELLKFPRGKESSHIVLPNWFGEKNVTLKLLCFVSAVR